MPDSEIELAGNGNHEMRSWLAVAGAVAPINATTLAYEPIYPWITGMAVAQWETQGDGARSVDRGAQDTRAEESRA